MLGLGIIGWIAQVIRRSPTSTCVSLSRLQGIRARLFGVRISRYHESAAVGRTTIAAQLIQKMAGAPTAARTAAATANTTM